MGETLLATTSLPRSTRHYSRVFEACTTLSHDLYRLDDDCRDMSKKRGPFENHWRLSLAQANRWQSSFGINAGFTNCWDLLPPVFVQSPDFCANKTLYVQSISI